jgi:hypothetical protein
MSHSDVPRTCPSARAEPGALLLGVIGATGRMKPLRTAMTVDAGFIAKARENGAPEARMRFANACVKGACAQWTGQHCGVIERVLGHLGLPPAPDALPPCLIRATCRWFAERGGAACGVCDQVVTDNSVMA